MFQPGSEVRLLWLLSTPLPTSHAWVLVLDLIESFLVKGKGRGSWGAFV